MADNELCGLDEDGDGDYNAEGIAKLADALKSNSSLRELKCARSHLFYAALASLTIFGKSVSSR